MIRREIEVDENTDRILAELASDYGGDLGKALRDLVLAREGMEEFADRSEGRTVSWEDLKARNRP